MLLIGGVPLKAQESVPFSLTANGHILIKAKVNGVEGNFIFDTGAGLNMFFKTFAEKLENKETHHFFVGHRATGEPLRMPLYRSKTLSLGDFECNDQWYTTFDLHMDGIDGILSLQAFRQTPVTIDYTKKELSFAKLGKKGKNKFITLETADYGGRALDIFTNVRLNDQLSIQIMLDSGAGDHSYWVDERFMDDLSIKRSTLDSIEKKSEFNANKISKMYIGKLAEIATENKEAKIENPSVNFVQGLIYEGKMSIAWLGKKITISIPEKRIYIAED
ncbi:hypothetical protein GCM10023231_06400 [Olivibacter ginsenosidimutans]|uniref:Aspartyl protease n=2 Tax=Olivibacter ginsenosidimutans TaxID=1176537 RepID=A0ABP9AI73_9SPHI